LTIKYELLPLVPNNCQFSERTIYWVLEDTIEVGFAVKNKFNLVEKTLKTENYYLQKH
jgi:hypothetical protein